MDVSVLRTFPLLNDFTDSELVDLFANAAEQTFPPGSFLCKEGERDGHLYFLISGEVEVSKTDADGHKHTLANLSGGTLLGELSWIMGTPCTANLKAVQNTVTVRLSGDALNKQLQERSPGAFKLSTALLRLLASRLLRMNDQFLQVQIKTNGNGQKKSEIERLRERILHDWSF
ncbi:MAG TPA: cyclic nucleotide-binding domain-containing protein [Methylomirabilota bacterium]|nr:cyclic nucleotide-binding domain-containing protein [Methylomirabilota bacterium]